MILARICFSLCLLAVLAGGCALWDDSGSKKPPPNNLIATPASYYSTAKAKYLGTKYKDNLDRIIERIVRNSKTAPLQFSNNISSVGGIGFFTHSATKTPDERYLEVVLATPETFETKGGYSEKIHQLFNRYGADLLSILSSDSEMYQDRELTGYGLNLAWRNVIAEEKGSRVTMARAIIYFPKEKVRSFLREEIKQNDLLRDAVIFGEEENGPLALVSYQPQAPRPDFRPAIREDNLTASAEPKAAAPAPAREAAAKPAAKPEAAKKENAPGKNSQVAAAKPPADARESKPEPPAAVKAASPGSTAESAKKTAPAAAETAKAEKAAPVATRQAVAAAQAAPVAEPKAPVEIARVAPAPETRPAEPESAAGTKAEDAGPAVAKESNPAALETRIPAQPVEAAQEQGARTAPAPKAAEKISEAKAPGNKSEAAAAQIAAAPIAPAQLPAPAPPITPAPAAPAAEIKKSEKPAPQVKTPAPTPVPVKPLEEIAVKPVEPMMLPAPERTEPPPAVAESKSAEPVNAPAQLPAPAVTAAEKPREQEAKAEVKASEPPIAKPAPVVIPSVATEPAATIAPAQKTRPAEAVKVAPESKASPVLAAKSIEEKKPQAQPAEALALAKPAAEPMASAPAAIVPAAVKPEPPAASAPAPAITPAPADNRSAEKPAGEQVAIVRKTPIEMVPENKALSRPPAPKALEGFIIQLAFHDKEKARSWAENMERRGYAVSITEAGSDGALRVRLGNFTVRDDAERQLRTFKQEGISGIIINLPQAFRPEVRSSLP